MPFSTFMTQMVINFKYTGKIIINKLLYFINGCVDPSEQTLAENSLKPNETYVNTFNPSDLEEGKYMISFLQDSGAVMSAYVKVEPIEKI